MVELQPGSAGTTDADHPDDGGTRFDESNSTLELKTGTVVATSDVPNVPTDNQALQVSEKVTFPAKYGERYLT